MLLRLLGLLVGSCWWLALPNWGQNRVLEGLVLDARTQQQVPFATIGVPQPPLGTAAGEAGTFRLVLPDGMAVPALVVSSVGYEAAPCPWPAGRRAGLRPASVALGQVVVRGGKVKTKTFGRTSASTLLVGRMYTEPDLLSDELGREQGTVVPVEPTAWCATSSFSWLSTGFGRSSSGYSSTACARSCPTGRCCAAMCLWT